jgi:hypothetical protein
MKRLLFRSGICSAALVGLLVSCKSQEPSKPSEPPTKQTLQPVTKPIAPVSVPVSVPIVAPVSIPTSAPTSVPRLIWSMPTSSTTAPTSAAAILATTEPTETKYYYMEGVYPNPKVEEQLSCESEDKETTCDITLRTTALYSCFCRTYHLLPPMERAPGAEVTLDVHTYFIEGDSIKEITVADFFQPKWARSYTEAFTVSAKDNGPVVTFYAGDGYPTQELSGDKLQKMLLPEPNPLMTITKTRDLPTNFENIAETQRGLTILPFEDTAAPASMPIEGKFLEGVRWRDKNGENVALFSEQKSLSKDKLKNTTYLYVNHYTKKDEVVTKLRNIADKQEKCDKPNNLASFFTKTIRVTDVDKDGVGELSFAYALGCVDDSSELHPIKLFLEENGEKYAFRGDSAHDYKADASLDKAPDIFSSFLFWQWSQAW